MVKYIARNIAVAWFFLILFVLIGMPIAYTKVSGIILAIQLIAYADIVLTLDKMGV